MTGDLTTALGQKADASLLFQCDIAFIGVGVALSRQGLSTGNIAEAALMRQMIDHSDQVVILADSSKLGDGMCEKNNGVSGINNDIGRR